MLYDLAIIPCTAKKNRLGRTAFTLYHGGPFSLMLRHAQVRAPRVLIMSSKYGLLAPDDPVEYYDLYLPDLEPLEILDLQERIDRQVRERDLAGITRGISYLPAAYFDVLEDVAPKLAEKLDRPFKGIRMMTAWKMMSQDLAKPSTQRVGLLP